MRVTSLEALAKTGSGVRLLDRVAPEVSYEAAAPVFSSFEKDVIPEKHLLRFLEGPFGARSPAVDVYEVDNAVILPNAAVMTLSGHVILDTLWPYHHYDDISKAFESRLRPTGNSNFDVRLSDITYRNETVFSLRDHGEAGFFHFVHSVLPRLFLWRSNPGLSGLRAYLAVSAEFQYDYLKALNAPLENFLLADGRALACKSLLVTTGLVRPDWESGGFFERPLWAAELLRNAFKDVPPADVQRFYISRRDSSIRAFVNEPELEALLESKFGFRIITLTGLSAKEQISLFKGANFVVGAHGAGLSQVCFMRRGSTVLEIFPNSRIWPTFRGVASRSGVKYATVVTRESQRFDIAAVDAALSKLLAPK